MPADRIADTASRVREAGCPDFLNLWIGITPERLAEAEAAARRRAERTTTAPRKEPTMSTAGPKEQQLRALKAEKTAGATAPAKPAPAEPSAKQETETMKTAKKAAPKPAAKKKAPTHRAKSASKATRAAKTATPATAAPAAKIKAGVPALEVAAFICREGGASMDELVKKFGIEAHPMRAKIFYVRHNLGYAVETKDGRYHGTAPAAKDAPK